MDKKVPCSNEKLAEVVGGYVRDVLESLCEQKRDEYYEDYLTLSEWFKEYEDITTTEYTYKEDYYRDLAVLLDDAKRVVLYELECQTIAELCEKAIKENGLSTEYRGEVSLVELILTHLRMIKPRTLESRDKETLKRSIAFFDKCDDAFATNDIIKMNLKTIFFDDYLSLERVFNSGYHQRNEVLFRCTYEGEIIDNMQRIGEDESSL